MSVAASVTNQQQSVVDGEAENETNDDQTVYQNQKVIDAADEGITYKVCVMCATLL